VQKGVRRLSVNGRLVSGNLIPLELLDKVNTVSVEMG
jgi:hypothetical protein